MNNLMNRSELIRMIRPVFENRPEIKSMLHSIDVRVDQVQHAAARYLPAVIRPAPRQLTVALTASCNLRCVGCRYGRDFMVGKHLPLKLMRDLLDDAKGAGVNTVRLYGGEPLLHPHIPEIVEHACSLAIKPYITSNGILLKEKVDRLYSAGLRLVTMGFYGIAGEYDAYVQRPDHFSRLDASIASVRDRYGDKIELQLNYVLMRQTCTMRALQDAWNFAMRHEMFFHVDLISFSLPFFTNDPGLRFTAEHRAALEEVTAELLRLKQAYPSRMLLSLMTIRSIPDWLLKGPEMRVPCDAAQQIYVAADGTVQLCEVTFKLGNLHDKRLRDLLFTQEHRQAARDAFSLNCPNCTCRMGSRILKDSASRSKYGRAVGSS